MTDFLVLVFQSSICGHSITIILSYIQVDGLQRWSGTCQGNVQLNWPSVWAGPPKHVGMPSTWCRCGVQKLLEGLATKI